MNLKRFAIFTFLFLGGLFILYRFIAPKLSVIQIGSKKPMDTVFVGPEKYQNTFAKALKGAEESAAPFRRGGQLMEAGEYDAALEAFKESLQKSHRSIEKTMAYRGMQMAYSKQGNLRGELDAIEAWFAEAGKNANNPEFEQRAAEIRSLLTAKK